MKITIIGTHSTGKTTLTRHLKAALEKLGHPVVVVSEVARQCPYPINEDATPEAQNWIVENQILQENKLQVPTGAIVLCDRASLDGFTYLHRAYTRHGIPEQATVWEEKAVAHMPTYDFIFKTQKLDLPSVADGERSTDEAFRTEIDTLMTYFLEKHRIPYHLLAAVLDYDAHIDFMLSKILPSAQYQQLQAVTPGFHSIHSLPLETQG